MPRLQPPLISAFPGRRRARRCPQCGVRIAADRACPECHMRPTTAYWLERLMRRRLRGALLKTTCVLLILAALLAGFTRKSHSHRAGQSHAFSTTATP